MRCGTRGCSLGIEVQKHTQKIAQGCVARTYRKGVKSLEQVFVLHFSDYRPLHLVQHWTRNLVITLNVTKGVENEKRNIEHRDETYTTQLSVNTNMVTMLLSLTLWHMQRESKFQKKNSSTFPLRTACASDTTIVTVFVLRRPAPSSQQ